MKFFAYIALTITLGMLVPYPASAQYESLINTLTRQLDITIMPEVPGPNENVTISVRSKFFNIDTAEIGWKLNGIPQSAGQGDKTFNFRTGNLGEKSVIEFIVAPPGETPFNQFIFVTPSSVELIWQALTYTPPFYLGKARMSHESIVSIVAIPKLYTDTGVEIPKESLLYSWKVNGKSLLNADGLGKYWLDVGGRYLYDYEDIMVRVSNQDKTTVAEKRITLRAENPAIGIYELHPLYGVLYNNNLANRKYTLQKKEITLISEPFYTSLFAGRIFPSVTYEWFMNDNGITQEKTNGTLTLRNETGETGVSNVMSKISLPGKDFQAQSVNVTIQFDE